MTYIHTLRYMYVIQYIHTSYLLAPIPFKVTNPVQTHAQGQDMRTKSILNVVF